MEPGTAAASSATRTRTLAPGDRVPSFVLKDQSGARTSASEDRVAGRPLLLVFQAGGPPELFLDCLSACKAGYAAFADLGASVFVVTREGVETNRVLHEELGLPFQVLSDPEGKVFGAFGLPDAGACGGAALFAIDPNQRVIRFVPADASSDRASSDRASSDRASSDRMAGDQVALALDGLRRAAAARPATILGEHPPVLVLPRVLGEADCGRLIARWNREVPLWQSDGLASDGFEREAGDFKVRNEAYGPLTQLVVRDAALQRFLDERLWRRLAPQIGKAFQTSVSQRESYRIACYDSAESGHLLPHRDNPTPETRHRRFTAAILLNAGAFEGGALRFREYGEQLYQVESGTAIVWSATLLHEVLPVTRGRRFILGTHLFGEGSKA